VRRFTSFYHTHWVPLPLFFVASVSIVMLGLPSGGAATSFESNIIQTTARSNAALVFSSTAPGTQTVVSTEVTSFVDTLLKSPKSGRPRSLAADTPSHRLLSSLVSFPSFVTAPSVSSNKPLSPDHKPDPRLPKRAKTWTLSAAFLARVGADKWALPGIGFPNVETHNGRILSHYKPYHALMDWQHEAERDEWTPVPAVYCMGLSAQEIAARVATHERRILHLAMNYGVSASLVKAVITKESCFDTQAVSKVGAEGLMQLMPETARWLNVTDSHDVDQNLTAGIRYLADLRKRFGSEELALAAYNAGPGNVERHGGIPPFQETQQYVKAVMSHYRRYAATTRFSNQRVLN